jgi:type 1 glutamine amidotransferase
MSWFTVFQRLVAVRRATASWVVALLLVSGFGSWSHAAEQPNAPPVKRRLVLLSQGPDTHPPTTHEYDAGMRLLAKILARAPGLEVEIVRADGAWEQGPEKLRDADGAVLFLSQGAKWLHEEPRRLEAFAQLAARGGGLSTLHWGMGTKDFEFIDGFVKLFGGCHGGPDRKLKVLETTVRPGAEQHEITTGIKPFRVQDEFYYQLTFIPAHQALKPVVTAEIDGQNETVGWAWERGDGGRSFGFTGCHFHRNWELPEYRRIVVQGILWTIKIPIPPDGIDVAITAEDLKLP